VQVKVVEGNRERLQAFEGTCTARAGSGTSETWIDITAIRQLLEKAATDNHADAAELAKYEKEIKPFLVPFDALFASGSVDGDLSHSVIYITVK
jgi:hypothetical protein